MPRDDSDDEPVVTGIYPASREYARQVGFFATLRAVVGAVVVIGAAAVGGWDRIGNMAEAKAKAQVAQLEPRLTAVEQLRVEIYDMRKENRTYFEAQRTGIPAPMPAPLPPPPPPPGRPDGGQ